MPVLPVSALRCLIPNQRLLARGEDRVNNRQVTLSSAPPLAPQVEGTIRVLHLSSGNLYGGVERIVTALGEFRTLCPSIVPIFGLAFDGRQADELRATGSPVHLLGAVRLSRPLSVRRARRALGRLLDCEKPDVVICHNPWAFVVYGPAIRRRGVPIVVWVHGALAGKNWLERWARRSRPTLIVANSRFTATTVETVFPQVRCEIIYPPARFRTPDPAIRSEVRKVLGVRESSIVILQVSRIEASKGHKAHLVGLAALRDDPSWVAWFAGGAQQPHERVLMQELRALAKELGVLDRVQFLGERTDVNDLLAASDVFCQPNATPDSFGLAFVEALAAGLPVLTTRMGGAIEVVDETCGILVPPGDDGALAAALARTVRDREFRRRLGNAGPLRAALLCDPAARLGDLRRALSTALSGSAANEETRCSR